MILKSFTHPTRRRFVQSLATGGLMTAMMPHAKFARAQSSGTQIRVLEWAGYEEPSLFKEYTDQGHAAPAFTFMSSDFDTINKLRTGISADLVDPTNNYLAEYLKYDLVEPWDTSLIARYESLIPAFKEIGMSNGQQYYIPVTWSYESVIYNAGQVEAPEQSYALLFDDKYAGRISWWDEPINLVLAGLVLGIENVWSMSDAELKEVVAFLSEKKKNIRSLWVYPTDFESDFISGSLVVTYGFTSSWLLAKSKGVDAVYMQPKEGRVVFVDGYCQLKGTKTKELNHAFVNAWLSPDSAIWMLKNYGYGHANTAIDFTKVDPVLVDTLQLKNPALLGSDKVRVRKHVERSADYAKAWDAVKAS